mgnify:CR=1 FL=1
MPLIVLILLERFLADDARCGSFPRSAIVLPHVQFLVQTPVGRDVPSRVMKPPMVYRGHHFEVGYIVVGIVTIPVMDIVAQRNCSVGYYPDSSCPGTRRPPVDSTAQYVGLGKQRLPHAST